MKKKIIAVIAFVLVVTGVPFCAIKGDEAARARAKEAAESQNKEWYKEANACIDAGEYEDAIKLLEKLPTDYEDSRYIIPYAEYCKGCLLYTSSGTRSLISGINRNYFEPYVMELVFEFTVNANTMIERQIRRMGSIQDDVEETMAGELYADGYKMCIRDRFISTAQRKCRKSQKSLVIQKKQKSLKKKQKKRLQQSENIFWMRKQACL